MGSKIHQAVIQDMTENPAGHQNERFIRFGWADDDMYGFTREEWSRINAAMEAAFVSGREQTVEFD